MESVIVMLIVACICLWQTCAYQLFLQVCFNGDILYDYTFCYFSISLSRIFVLFGKINQVQNRRL